MRSRKMYLSPCPFAAAYRKARFEQEAENQYLLKQLGITLENMHEYEICYNDKQEIVRIQRVMKATIWEKKQNAN
jgi:hypothetical protein